MQPHEDTSVQVDTSMSHLCTGMLEIGTNVQ